MSQFRRLVLIWPVLLLALVLAAVPPVAQAGGAASGGGGGCHHDVARLGMHEGHHGAADEAGMSSDHAAVPCLPHGCCLVIALTPVSPVPRGIGRPAFAMPADRRGRPGPVHSRDRPPQMASFPRPVDDRPVGT